MARVPDAPSSASESKTWLIVGASRGIGHEFVRQLLKRGDRVLATTRQGGAKANQIWSEARDDGNCRMFSCDVSSEKSIKVRDIQQCYDEWSFDKLDLRSGRRNHTGSEDRLCCSECGRASIS